MECLFGITGKDYTIIAADTTSARSIVVMKGTEDKSRDLNDHTVMVFSGEPGDTVNFAEYIQRNIKLYKIRNDTDLSPKAAATFTRRELADSLRSRVMYIYIKASLSSLCIVSHTMYSIHMQSTC